MGLMDKFKNLFTEEVEDEYEEEPIKKEVRKVEIPSPVVKEVKEVKEEKVEKKEEKKEDDFKFPFFDDEDFHTEEKVEKKVKSSYKRSSYKPEKKEVYKPVKEEKKIFKPTPIISPVYGILDKNYQKEDLKSKPKHRSYYEEVTVDEIRNKAYGSLEDTSPDVFDKKGLIDDLDLSNDLSEDNEQPRHGNDDFSDLLKEKEIIKENSEPRKISDKELFNMIDSMYKKGDNQ